VTRSLSDIPSAAALLGVPAGLFTSAFALNDHGFLLIHVPDGASVGDLQVLYANPAYLRLFGSGAMVTTRSMGAVLPAGAIKAFPQVIAEQVPTSYLGYEPSWQRWVHLYLFPASQRIAGAFVADPVLLTGDGAMLHRSPANFGDLVIDHGARRVTMQGEQVSLTRTEYELLALLAQNPNRVISRMYVLKALWDTSWLGSSPALDVHVSRLRRKLGESGARPRYIHSIRGSGLIFVPDPSPSDQSTPNQRPPDYDLPP